MPAARGSWRSRRKRWSTPRGWGWTEGKPRRRPANLGRHSASLHSATAIPTPRHPATQAASRATRPAQTAYLVPGQPGEVTRVTFKFRGRIASFRNEFGLFLVDDATGRIGELRPRDPGYAAAALEGRQVVFSRNQKPGTVTNLVLPAGRYFATYLVQNGTSRQFLASNPENRLDLRPRTFFSFTAANPDHFQHVRRPAPNVLAWEDQTRGGDKDFNDAVVGFNYSVQPDQHLRS